MARQMSKSTAVKAATKAKVLSDLAKGATGSKLISKYGKAARTGVTINKAKLGKAATAALKAGGKGLTLNPIGFLLSAAGGALLGNYMKSKGDAVSSNERGPKARQKEQRAKKDKKRTDAIFAMTQPEAYGKVPKKPGPKSGPKKKSKLKKKPTLSAKTSPKSGPKKKRKLKKFATNQGKRIKGGGGFVTYGGKNKGKKD
tara:strand:- start:145 stop:744 length:600 start_codon:yes stop_codon:yes gene_type:complete